VLIMYSTTCPYQGKHEKGADALNGCSGDMATRSPVVSLSGVGVKLGEAIYLERERESYRWQSIGNRERDTQSNTDGKASVTERERERDRVIQMAKHR